MAKLIETPGISGYEYQVSQEIANAFKPYCDEVMVDDFYNVYGKKIGGVTDRKPKIMLAAHMDEIGLMVKKIEKGGFIKFTNIGGVDPRILPAQEVWVHGKETLFGVIGAKPPHLQTQAETDKAIPIDDMAIDVGLPEEEVRKLVNVGDLITFKSPLISMQGDIVNGKSIDDRAGVVLLYQTMQELDRLKFDAEVYFVATVQEEVGTRGAIISTYRVNPDIGIAIDVTHANTPDAPREETFPIDKGPTIAVGPNLHPKLTKKLMDVAKENNIEFHTEVEPGPTGTDARSMQISRAGVPTVLIGLPLRYMHTTVESLSMSTIK
ncbi:MAG: M20/M25/M40 family metallo-hydrolase, partial [Tissierellales bacterium]